ncbi:protein TRM32-like [Punica granatum]|uniref:Protein TRM32-like n=1 Tax=Punica granatum TaxID=22663 RepID=A0A6P8D4L9_PUNGR|nr:protein TRM32-like [Punica granatum]
MRMLLEERLCYDGDFEEIPTSCFKGIVDIFRYNKAARSIILRRKHQGGRYYPSDGTPDTISICSGTGEGPAFMSSELDPIVVLENPTKAIPLTETSVPALVSFRGKEMKCGKNQKDVECFGDPIIIFPERDGTTENKLRDPNSFKAPDEIGGDNTTCQVCGFTNPVDKKSENEKLHDAETKKPALQILQDPAESLITKAKFAKSVTFPAVDTTNTSCYRLPTRKHKESESWSFSNTVKRLVEESVPASSHSLENDTKPDAVDKTSNAVTGLVQKLDLWGWNRLIVKRFNFIKQRLKRALSPRDTRPRAASKDLSIARADFQEDSDQDHEGSSNRKGIESYADYRGRDVRLGQRSRTSSLNESLKKYARLFGNGLNTDAKLEYSRSLTLRNEEGVFCSSWHGKKIFRRRLSLPDLDSFDYLLGELDHSSADTESHSPNKSNPRCDVGEVDENKGSDAVERAEGTTTPFVNSPEDSANLTMKRDIPENEAESTSGSEVNIALKQETRCSSIEPAMLDWDAGSTYSPHSGGAGFNLHDNISSTENVRIPNVDDDAENVIRSYYRLDKKAEANFNFVRDLLELSGLFDVEGKSPTWFATNYHQLSPSLLKDLDILPLYDLDLCNRKLLFDLVKESLVEIRRRSSICIPRASPKEKYRILEEVWKRVYWYQRLSSGMNRSLNDVVAQDMKRGSDIWMNVTVDSKYVGLELEDLIFDELLDEVFD